MKTIFSDIDRETIGRKTAQLPHHRQKKAIRSLYQARLEEEQAAQVRQQTPTTTSFVDDLIETLETALVERNTTTKEVSAFLEKLKIAKTVDGSVTIQINNTDSTISF